VLTTDEITHPQKNVKIWDISNLPTIPTATSATFTVDPASTVHNVHVRGDYAYCAWYNGYGLQIINITNPTLPTLAAGYRTSSSSLAWETYPYFPSGKVILGDGSTGLWIFRFTELAPRRPIEYLQPANNDTVRSRISFTFRWRKTADPAKDPHWYELRLRGAGLDTTWLASDSVALFSNPAALQALQRYTWRVTVRDEWNATATVDSFSFIYKPSGSTEVGGQGQPIDFGLDQNYPNPFNPSTRIDFRLPASAHTSLAVYDLLGREVASLVDEQLQAGYYSKTLNADKFATGIYFCRLVSGNRVETKRMLLIR
jgi:uncharacterized protein YodC (DUF2158 family)